MTKKLLAAIGLLALCTVLIYSCTKSNNAGDKKTTSASTLSWTGCSLDFGEVNIGQTHNNTLLTLLNGVDLTNQSTAQSEITQRFENISYDPTVLGITREEFNDLTDELLTDLEAADYDLRNMTGLNMSSTVEGYLNSVLEEIDDFTDISTLNTNLSVIEGNAINNLTCQDLDLVLATIKVAKSSAYFWASTEDGGLGMYETYFPPVEPPTGGGDRVSEETKKLIKNVIVGDASTLSASFLKMGTMIAIGLEVPGANVAILVGLALDAAIGSAMAALFG